MISWARSCCRATSTSCGPARPPRSRGSPRPGRAAGRACRGRRAASSGTTRGTDPSPRCRGPPATAGRPCGPSTASWLDPESNQTSRMSRSRSNSRPPHVGHASPSGRNSSIGRSYHASAPCSANTAAALLGQRGGQHRLAALDAVDRRDRHAPGPLPRDAPVGPVGEHERQPLLAPCRDPLHLLDRLDRLLAQARGVHRDEPLRGGEEDHRVWQRQQCGYECSNDSRCQRRLRSGSASSIFGLASNTRWPANSSTSSRKCPPGPTGA